ncbi:hypothetical protein ACSSS7_000162 [Eimeria intestinalis]
MAREPTALPARSAAAMLRQPKRLTLSPALEREANQEEGKSGQQQEQQQARRRSLRPRILLGGPQASDSWRAPRGPVSRRSCVAVHASLSRAGCTYPGVSKTNQDAVGVAEGWGREQDAYWFSVYDGHGPTGHHVSSRVCQKLPLFVAEAWMHHKDLRQAFSQGFKSASQDLKTSSLNVECNGTTCVSCVVQGSVLYTANLGDSRAILGREGAPQGEGAPCWQAVELTRDHKPELEDERKRILAAGGRIAALQEDGQPCGPLRVWLQSEDLPGLAMSRSLGDTLACRAGVISEPEVTVLNLSPADRFLLLATDGVWEFISNEEAVQTLKPFVEARDPAGGCEALVKKAQRRWEEEDGAVDDITCLLVILQCP